MKRGILLVVTLTAVGTAYLGAQRTNEQTAVGDTRSLRSAAVVAPRTSSTTPAISNVKSSTTRRKLAPAVLGKDTPEKISDDIAYRMFFAMVDHVATRSRERRASAYLTQVFVAAERAGGPHKEHPECVNIELATIRHRDSTQRVFAFMRAHQDDTRRVDALRRNGNGRAYSEARQAWAARLRAALRTETSPAIARDVDWYVTNVVKKRTVIHIAPPSTTF